MHGRGGHGLEEAVDLFPAELRDAEVRNRLKQFARELDQLAAAEDGEVVVDSNVVDRLLSAGHFPQELHDRVRGEAHQHLGRRLKTDPRGRKLRWHDLREHGAPIEPVSVAELQQLGLGSDTSAERAKEILREHFPEIPSEILDADGRELHRLAVRALEHNRTVWDCCVAHLGWWATLFVFAVAGAFLIVGTATGPWGIPLLIWLIGVLGGGTAVIVFNCVLNPNR